MASVTYFQNSSKTIVESWFVPFDILTIIENILCIIISMFCLILILFDKTCRTVSMLLVGNSCFSTVMFATAMLLLTTFTLQNDLKQIEYFNSFCIFSGYLTYVTCSSQNYSFLLQAIYRYLLIVHPARQFCHSYQIQIFFIFLSWIIAFLLPMLFLFTHQIIYDLNNQTCQVPLRLSFFVIYMSLSLFGIPLSLIFFIYGRLVRYVKQMNRGVTPINRLSRAQRDLKMVRRIVILVIILLTICLPYEIFVFMSFFNRAPKYHFRIAFMCGDTSMIFTIITLFLFTDPLKKSLLKRMNK